MCAFAIMVCAGQCRELKLRSRCNSAMVQVQFSWVLFPEELSTGVCLQSTIAHVELFGWERNLSDSSRSEFPRMTTQRQTLSMVRGWVQARCMHPLSALPSTLAWPELCDAEEVLVGGGKLLRVLIEAWTIGHFCESILSAMLALM